MTSVLYDVKPVDPAAFGSAMLTLASTALLACWLPARRATRVNPMAALRAD
jgi:ABC-type lipoprotein release transport system permease subunit